MATADMSDSAPTTPKLLGPDYFKVKRVPDSDSSLSSLNGATSADGIGPASKIGEVTADYHLASPTYSYPGRPCSLALQERKQANTCRTRNTPVAEAAIRREELNRKKREKLTTSLPLGAVNKQGKVEAWSRVSPVVSSITRDCAGDWMGWRPNDLDTNLQQPTTRPFLESTSTTNSLTTVSPTMENFNSWGQPITSSSSEDVAQSSSDVMMVSTTPAAKTAAGSEATAEMMDDEVMADLLQQQEYSLHPDINHEDWSYSVAKMYQEDLDATAAQELQQRETHSHEDVADGSRYLYKAPWDVQVKNRMLSSSFEENSDLVTGRTKTSSPSTGQRMEQKHGLSKPVADQDCHQATVTPAVPALTYSPAASVSSQCTPYVSSIAGGHGATRRGYQQEENLDMSYEELLNLEDVSCGLSKEVIAYCTNTRSYKEIEGTSVESRTCPVCLTEFREGQLMRYLPCLHSFHCHCIDQWLDSHTNCPVCMKNIEELHMAMSN